MGAARTGLAPGIIVICTFVSSAVIACKMSTLVFSIPPLLVNIFVSLTPMTSFLSVSQFLQHTHPYDDI